MVVFFKSVSKNCNSSASIFRVIFGCGTEGFSPFSHTLANWLVIFRHKTEMSDAVSWYAIGFLCQLSLSSGPPVNVTCNIFINSFGSVTETTMVRKLPVLEMLHFLLPAPPPSIFCFCWTRLCFWDSNGVTLRAAGHWHADNEPSAPQLKWKNWESEGKVVRERGRGLRRGGGVSTGLRLLGQLRTV